MKKILSLAVALGLVVSLTACGSSAIPLTGSSSQTSSSSTPASSSEPAASSAPAASSEPAASSAPAATGDDVYPDSDGYATGYMGDVLHTRFFNFTVNSGYLCSEFEGYTPAEGNELLVVELTITNTDTVTQPMFDTDFQAQWGEDDDPDAYAFPIEQIVSDDQLPAEYDLPIKAVRTGLVVYEVPQGYKDFSISYMEYFANGDTGDTFFIYFTPEANSSSAAPL